MHAETCTLHLDPARHQPEQLVVQSLFADGHIRYSVGRAAARGPALAFLASREALVPGSLGAMGWSLGDRGMRMTLAREVPELIAGSLKGFLRGLFDRLGRGRRPKPWRAASSPCIPAAPASSTRWPPCWS